MAGVVRVGDSVSCGDHAGQGSSDVFMGGMPVVTKSTPSTTGHGCFPPSRFIGPYSKSVFVNGSPIALKGKTKIAVHSCGKNHHDGIAMTGSGSVLVEGS